MSFAHFSDQTLAITVVLLTFLILIWCTQWNGIQGSHWRLSSERKSPPSPKSSKPTGPADKRNIIEPLLNFDLWKVDPIQYRPYKTQGHISMGILQRTRNEWIRMDRGYLARIQNREHLIQSKAEYTIGTGPLVDPAIEELYSEIMIDYLPNRYPTIFKKHGKAVHNVITGSTYPLSTAGLKPEQMLKLLGTNVEEDFYFMCPDKIDGEFRLRGYIACFPGGFLSPARVGESVREIHQPVPGYEDRLGKSVDRYFHRMEPGQFIGRMNWSLQVDGADLFRTDGNNYYPDTAQTVSEEKFHPNFDQCFLRVEHQTLTRLPCSNAIVFCVRSYMTSLKDIRNEGDGPRLADAITNMPEKLGLYKMRPFWSEEILPWLRKEPAELLVQSSGAELAN